MYFSLTDQREKFINMQLKKLQAFLVFFSAESQPLFENWFKGTEVWKDFRNLKELFIKDRFISAHQTKISNYFLMVQKAGEL